MTEMANTPRIGAKEMSNTAAITMTLAEARDYYETAIEMESEMRAEYGSGCVSLGYDAGEWASAYEGYRTSDDPKFAEAKAIVDADFRARVPLHPPVDTSDDLPF
jgi:hypothetical protein